MQFGPPDSLSIISVLTNFPLADMVWIKGMPLWDVPLEPYF